MPTTGAMLVAMVIVHSNCMGIVGNTLVCGVTPGAINDVDSSCMHVCVNDNVNIYLDNRATRVVDESLTSEFLVQL